jgi:hypothetical protein
MEISKNGFRLVIEEDLECSHNPREEDCLGTMVFFHKRYTLGDKHKFEDPQELNEWLENSESKLACVLPIYMYDHSLLAFSTTPFSCSWDSGQLGYIYATYEKANEYFGEENMPKEKLEETLKQELQDYEKYVNGEQQFYSYAIYDSNNECVDSCTGFELIDDNFNELVTEIAQHIDDKYKFLTQEMLKKKQVQLEQE